MEALSAKLIGVVNAAEPRLRQLSVQVDEPVLAGGWSRRQLLGHLIDSASNNHQRFVRAALADALEFPAYDTPNFVRVQAVERAPWPVLVDLWASYNRYLAHVIANLPADKLEVICRIGANEPVTLRYLAEDYVRHLVQHLVAIGYGSTWNGT